MACRGAVHSAPQCTFRYQRHLNLHCLGPQGVAFGDVVLSEWDTSYLLGCCISWGMTSNPLGKFATFLVALPKKAIACGSEEDLSTDEYLFFWLRHGLSILDDQ